MMSSVDVLDVRLPLQLRCVGNDSSSIIPVLRNCGAGYESKRHHFRRDRRTTNCSRGLISGAEWLFLLKLPPDLPPELPPKFPAKPWLSADTRSAHN